MNKNWWEFCICPKIKIKKKYSPGDIVYDYFEDVKDKYPEEVYQAVMPE